MSSMAESTAARISRHLECPVCLDIYDKPKALPCQHTFCLSCIERTSKGENTIQCPSCKTFHRLPNGNADDFPNNYTLMPMIEELQQIRLHEAGDIFDPHPESLSAVDQQLQQDTLKDIESRADTLDLIVNRLQALQETVSSNSVQVKSAIATDFGHLIRSLQEREQELQHDVALQTHTENSRLQTLKGEVAAEARQLRELCIRQRTALSGCRKVTAEKWRDMIRQGDQHLQRIAQTCKRYEQVEYRTTEFCADSERLKTMIEGVRNYGSLSIRQEFQHVLLQRTRLHSLPVENLQQTRAQDTTSRQRNITHDPANTDERHRSQSASRFPKRGRSLDTKVPETVTSYTALSRHAEIDVSVRSHASEKGPNSSCIIPPSSAHHELEEEIIDTRGRTRTIRESTRIIEGTEYDPIYPLGIAVLPSGKLAVASGSALRIFNTEGVESTPRAPLKTKKARVLADVCCLTDGTILATDSFNNEVLQFSSNGRPRGAFSIQELGKKLQKTIKPYGITCNRKGFLYICDRENNGVVVCRPNGIVDRIIGSTGPNRLKDPLYLALHKNETVLYVTDCKAAVVMVFTVEGDYIRQIPNAGITSGNVKSGARFSRPAGISVTMDGSLVVCDSDEHTVHILDQNTGVIMASIGDNTTGPSKDNGRDGTGAEQIAECALERPMGVVCIDHVEGSDSIAVCDTGNNRIQMYTEKRDH